MKSFKTIYMTLHNGDIVFPREVQYYEDGFFICTDPNENKYITSTDKLFKFSQDDFDVLIKNTHYAINNHKGRLMVIRNIEDTSSALINIFPNGHIECNDYSCTLYVPRNCLRWEYALIKGYNNNSYILEPCDVSGKITEHRVKDINPYTNNCNMVYSVILNNPGINTSELIDTLGWPPNSVTSRISELTASGRICSVGRVTNPRTGRKVHKWAVSEKGF